MCAASHGHYEVIQLLLAADASLMKVTSNDGVNALMLAAVDGDYECVELLLEEGMVQTRRVARTGTKFSARPFRMLA